MKVSSKKVYGFMRQLYWLGKMEQIKNILIDV